MIRTLTTANVGPYQNIDVSFAERLNLITGDNGLGKSFLLDIIWYAMTHQWPGVVNPHLKRGTIARQTLATAKSTIEAQIPGLQKEANTRATFSPDTDRWTFSKDKPVTPGLILYVMADGSCAIYDAERPCRTQHEQTPQALFLTNKEVYNGLNGVGDAILCNGMITDLSTWSDSRSYGYLANQMNGVLKALSPLGETYSAGLPMRVDVNDSRRIPTINMPYGVTVPITQASSGIQRIAELAYMLVGLLTNMLKSLNSKERRSTLA